MKVSYLDASHSVAEREFEPFTYNASGEPEEVTAVLRLEPGQRSFVTKSEYRDVVRSFRGLSEKHKKVLQDTARRTLTRASTEPSAFDQLSSAEKADYTIGMKQVGLSNSYAQLAVVYDHTVEKDRLRNMPVYNVNNIPLPALGMLPATVSFYMGANMHTAQRYFNNAKSDPAEAQRLLARELGEPKPVRNAPARSAAPSAHTPG